MNSLSSPHLETISIKTAADVFHAKNWGLAWGDEIITELKSLAIKSDRQRCRLCLNPSKDDSHQEMLIVMTKRAIERPQRRVTGFDTKIILEGKANLIYFNEKGEKVKKIQLGDIGAKYVHTNSNYFHNLSVESDFLVYLEILKGPFDSNTTEFASWGTEQEKVI